MAEYYNYIKSLHLIFVITWFAGLFYMPRLFIYHIESKDKPKAAADTLASQFRIMERRLWNIITWPSAVLCTLTALLLLHIMPDWLYQPWMWVKLGFVVLLIVYHLVMHLMYLEFQREAYTYSSQYMRIWNEGATMILFAVVFLAILKNAIDWIWGVIGMVILAALIMLGIKVYKLVRDREEGKE